MNARGERDRTIGVLLAAGRGTRLGGTKQLLPLAAHGTPRIETGPTTLVAAAFDSVAGACDEMIVVLGHEASEIAAALAPRSFAVVNADPDAEMIVSVQAGVIAALDRGAQRVVLHLGDHPAVRPETVAAVVQASRAAPDRAFIPTWQGRGGHPIVIPARLCARVLGWQGSGGLRGFWQSAPETWFALAVDDPGVRLDIDTPSDYHRL